MNENETNGYPFQSLFIELEDQFNEALVEKRAAFAVGVAGVAGLVYRSAVSEGVPADLAKTFAAEYWDREMNPAAVPTTSVFDLDEEDE
ncbi:hypothetical protein ACFTZI_20555 [Streptomyces decoyicus]|uniref:hypothetical protein n=1 Tax=Streptomyces decoyicus TaxID=249567 RepID=UPI00362E8F1B